MRNALPFKKSDLTLSTYGKQEETRIVLFTVQYSLTAIEWMIQQKRKPSDWMGLSAKWVGPGLPTATHLGGGWTPAREIFHNLAMKNVFFLMAYE